LVCVPSQGLIESVLRNWMQRSMKLIDAIVGNALNIQNQTKIEKNGQKKERLHSSKIGKEFQNVQANLIPLDINEKENRVVRLLVRLS
jgi:hypothetical protein